MEPMQPGSEANDSDMASAAMPTQPVLSRSAPDPSTLRASSSASTAPDGSTHAGSSPVEPALGEPPSDVSDPDEPDPSGPGDGFPEYERPAPSVNLTAVEARVVGALIEKSFLTPDIYPMTTNAMVSASNQKTNRDPVMSLDAVTIDGALMELRQRNLVRRVHTQGSRSTKHRHALDEVLSLDQGALAVVSVLLLRGAQTVGELRLRTERQHGFETLEEVDACLEGLASRGLVQQLARQPGQKEARWQHLLGDGEDAEAAATAPAGSAPAAPTTVPTAAPTPTATPAATPGAPSSAAAPPAPAADQDLIDRVGELEAEVETLRGQLRRLAEQLGESLD